MTGSPSPGSHSSRGGGGSGYVLTPRVDTTKTPQRACSHCARLKMKCQWPGSGNARSGTSCTRCTRLELPCSIPEPTKRKKRGKSTRVAQLEQKIDGIVSLLSSGSHTQGQSPLHHSTWNPNGSDQNHLVSQTYSTNQRPASRDYGCGSTTVPPDMTLDLASFELFPGFRLTREEANHWLDVYRKDLMPNFPYVIIPADADALAFHSESRVLFWTVMAAAVPFSAHMVVRFKEWFKSYIAKHVVVQDEKTLEILQAIMLYLSWGDASFYANNHVTTLVQIGTSIFLDLKLQIPPAAHNPKPSTLLGDAFTVFQRGASKDGKGLHSRAEKRVLLGWWTMTSMQVGMTVPLLFGKDIADILSRSSSLFGRYCALPWTAYMTACCESLTQQNEHAPDALVVSSVRMQRLAEKGFHAVPRIDPTDAVPLYTPSVEMALAGAKREMAEFWKTQSKEAQKNYIIASHYHAVLLRLYEPIISMSPPDHTGPGVQEPHLRTDGLWACLAAARNLFDSVLSISPEQITTVPIQCHSPIAFAVVTSSRLLLADPSPDWEPSIARRSFSFADITRRLGEKFEEADKVARQTRPAEDAGEGEFAQYGARMRWVSQWYLSRVQEKGPFTPFGMLNPRSTSAEPEGHAAGVGSSGQCDDYGVMPDEVSEAVLDESFWQVLSGNMAPDLMQSFATSVAGDPEQLS